MAEELAKTGCCELQTGNAGFALRLAEKLARLGHSVSLWPSKPHRSQQLISPSTLTTPQYHSFPTISSVSETPNFQTTPHRPSSSTAPLAPKVSRSAIEAGMKAKLEVQWAVCQKRNMKIASDSKRFYVSADVSDSLATHLMQMLTSLLSSPHAKRLWEPAFHMVLSDALSEIPLFGEYLSSISNDRESGELLETTKHEEIEMRSNELEMALTVSVRRASAALALLGGYREILKAGSKVLVTGLSEYQGEVKSLSSDLSTASVCLFNSSSTQSPSFFPTSRLSVKKFEPLPLTRLGLAPALSHSLFSLLIPTVSGLTLSAPLPSPPTVPIALSRLLADLRVRAVQAMCEWILEPELQEEMGRECPAAMEILHLMANECSPGERLSMIDRQRQTLRQLYIDTVRPTPPPPPLECRQLHDMTWDLQRDFPPPRGCVLCFSLSCVLFLGENVRPGINLPRGCFLYSSCPIPAKAPSFYWELEVISFGERHGGEDGPVLSFGLAPSAVPSPFSWKNPMGSCLFHNNGRVVHYNGSSLLQWKSIRLDISLVPGDVVGLGWQLNSTPGAGPPQGRVFFCLNGHRMKADLDGVIAGMWPVIHMQKANTKVRANFGSRRFLYAPGRCLRSAADLASESTEEITQNFLALPFAGSLDIDEGAGIPGGSGSGVSQELPCRVKTSSVILTQYDSSASSLYHLPFASEGLLLSGPSPSPPHPPVLDPDIDDDITPQAEPLNLLLRAWEQRVFPVIRKRFRNEAERRSGLDQIRGALSLGMVDIAQQTVEFLYEENGGIPSNLHIPSIDDVQAEAVKLSLERLHRGDIVGVRELMQDGTACGVLGSRCGNSQLPQSAVQTMSGTFGHLGTVLNIDTANELVMVETYLPNEGLLTSFWYPIGMLEKALPRSRRSGVGGTGAHPSRAPQIHRNLLQLEASLCRLYCRDAVLSAMWTPAPSLSPSGSLVTSDYSKAISFCNAVPSQVCPIISVEQLHLLASHLLAPPIEEGRLSSLSILLCQPPLQPLPGAPSTAAPIFYGQGAETLSAVLNLVYSQALSAGQLTSLVQELFDYFKGGFLHDEILVQENVMTTDIYLPGAALISVSVRDSPDGFENSSSVYKASWARVSSYSGGFRLSRTGSLSPCSSISFPRYLSSAFQSLSPNEAPCYLGSHYSQALLPGDRVRVCYGADPSPGVVLFFHAIPPTLPLVLTFTENLLQREESTVPINILLLLAEEIGNVLWISDLPPSIKEIIFHLMAEIIRRSFPSLACTMPSPLPNSLCRLLASLRNELGNFSDVSLCFPVYARALFEVCEASIVAEALFSFTASCSPLSISSHPTSSRFPSLCVSGSHLISCTPPYNPSSCSPSPSLPSFASSHFRCRIPQPKTDRHTSPPLTPPTSSTSTSLSASSSTSSGASSSELTSKFPAWLSQAATLVDFFRSLSEGLESCRQHDLEMYSKAWKETCNVSFHARLLIVRLPPCCASPEDLAQVLERACEGHGGLAAPVWMSEIPWREANVKKSESYFPHFIPKFHPQISTPENNDPIDMPPPDARNISSASLPVSVPPSNIAPHAPSEDFSLDSDSMPSSPSSPATSSPTHPAGSFPDSLPPTFITSGNSIVTATTSTSFTTSSVDSSSSVERCWSSFSATQNASDDHNGKHDKSKMSWEAVLEVRVLANAPVLAETLPRHPELLGILKINENGWERQKTCLDGEGLCAEDVENNSDESDEAHGACARKQKAERVAFKRGIQVYHVPADLSDPPTLPSPSHLDKYLNCKLLQGSELSQDAQNAFTQIFMTGAFGNGCKNMRVESESYMKTFYRLGVKCENLVVKNTSHEIKVESCSDGEYDQPAMHSRKLMAKCLHTGEGLSLRKEQLIEPRDSNLVPLFLAAVKPPENSLEEYVNQLLQEFGVILPRAHPSIALRSSPSPSSSPSSASPYVSPKYRSRIRNKDDKRRARNKDQESNFQLTTLDLNFKDCVQAQEGEEMLQTQVKDSGSLHVVQTLNTESNHQFRVDNQSRKKQTPKVQPEMMDSTSHPTGRNQGSKLPAQIKDPENKHSTSFHACHKQPPHSPSSELCLTLPQFLQAVSCLAASQPRVTSLGLASCGFDTQLRLRRVLWHVVAPETYVKIQNPTKEEQVLTLRRDVAVVILVERLSRRLNVPASRLHAHDLIPEPGELEEPCLTSLHDVSLSWLGFRFALLRQLNSDLLSFVLTHTDLALRPGLSHSLAAIFRKGKDLLFYESKAELLFKELDETARRGDGKLFEEMRSPEILLHPLEHTTGRGLLSAASVQLLNIPSPSFLVPVARGSDPIYPFLVRYIGEHVQGNSGSFRQFLWQVCKEVQSSALPLLSPCPSSSAGLNKDCFILTPGKMTFQEEQLLHTLGLLVGCALRADLPLPLQLLTPTWRAILLEKETNKDQEEIDLREADISTYNLLRSIEEVETEDELQSLCAGLPFWGARGNPISQTSTASPLPHFPSFMFPSLTRELVELEPGGAERPLTLSSLGAFVDGVRRLRSKELHSQERVQCFRAGLGSVCPLSPLSLLTHAQLQLTICGEPFIDIGMLQYHTIYQADVTPSDNHVLLFWDALRSFSPEERSRFLQFASNMERLPASCPCLREGPDTPHVPPYPMKIAPADNQTGSPDSRYVRAETCLFLVKLPAYSSLSVMAAKLRFAMHHRQDPLSG
uniref:probable E3 ubiquitin-protein ligase HECTD4 n=1 Tax=Myxine glutinosa TaxID=7769 RepID=UPI00358EC7DF